MSTNIKEISSLLVTGLQLYYKCIDNLMHGNDTIKKEYQEMLNLLIRTFNCFKFYAKSMLPRLESIAKQINIAETILNKTAPLDDQEKKSIEIVINQISQHLFALKKYDDERVRNLTANDHLVKLRAKLAEEIKQLKNDNILQKYPFLASLISGTVTSPVAYLVSRTLPAGLIAFALASLATYLVIDYTKGSKEQKSNDLVNMEVDIRLLTDYFNDIMQHSDEICMHKNTLECDMQNLQSCLLDELQREINRNICKNTIDTINEAAESCKLFIKAHEQFSKKFC